MANVTYLLGAGASANCPPIYTNFRERFSTFINRLSFFNNPQYLDLKNEITAIGQDIIAEFNFHNTPDTIAKKYFHKGDIGSLVSLKRVVILFFIYEQTLNDIWNARTNTFLFKAQFDKRYDSFLASILRPLKGKLKILKQFKILTWNYDLQFEIAFANYSSQSIVDTQYTIQSLPYLLQAQNKIFNDNEFSLIHLNGIALSSEGDSVLLGKFYSDDAYPFHNLINCYRRMKEHKETESIFSFAWEKYNEGSLKLDDDILSKAIKTANNTEILVVIGYSFPIFNRDIDRLLFEEMESLEKIYIQSEQFDKIGNIIQNDFGKKKGFLIDGSIIDIGFTDQFFIPPEWDYEEPQGMPIAFR